jgi:hypothetical protein
LHRPPATGHRPPATGHRPPATGHRPPAIVPLVVAVILLTAAVFKTHQLTTEPLLRPGLLQSRWFLLAVIEYECLLAFWLISGLFPRTAWWASLGTFSLFAVVAVGKLVSGELSCGCFGRVPTSPWIALGIDVGAVLALAFHRCGPHDGRRGVAPEAVRRLHKGVMPRPTPRTFALAWAAAAFACGGMVWFGMLGESLANIGQRFGDVIVVEPDRMGGKSFDLAKYIDIGDELVEGRWLVLLYRPGCPECEALMRTLSRSGGSAARAESLAFVAVASVPLATNPDVSGIRWGRLDSRAEWGVVTPLVIEVAKNRVVRVFQESAVLRYRRCIDAEAAFEEAVGAS